MQELPQERLIIAVSAIGAMERALDETAQRMAADALTVSAFSEATIASLIEHKSDEAKTVCDHIETVVQRLSSLARRINKAA